MATQIYLSTYLPWLSLSLTHLYHLGRIPVVCIVQVDTYGQRRQGDQQRQRKEEEIYLPIYLPIHSLVSIRKRICYMHRKILVDEEGRQISTGRKGTSELVLCMGRQKLVDGEDTQTSRGRRRRWKSIYLPIHSLVSRVWLVIGAPVVCICRNLQIEKIDRQQTDRRREVNLLSIQVDKGR